MCGYSEFQKEVVEHQYWRTNYKEIKIENIRNQIRYIWFH